MIKVTAVFGTRPEAIKMAPVILALKKDPVFETSVVLTGQHREMLDQVMSLFNFKASFDLNIMKDKQTLSDITVGALSGLENIFKVSRPDIVLVQGDTTTAFAAALASFYQKIPVGHIEAGLRTDDIYNPYPEEMNRRMITALASLHFAPTREAKQNLLKGGVDQKNIFLTGNTVVDALLYMTKNNGADLPDEYRKRHKVGNRVIFVETHRRENLGEPMRRICGALKKLTEKYGDVEVVFSVHRNPLVREVVFDELQNLSRVILLEPVDYPVMIKLMEESFFIMTDSGGLQEEAPSLGRPVIILRDNTERPEGIRAGTAVLAGTCENNVFSEASGLLDDGERYTKMAKAANPYGDGLASERIASIIRSFNDVSLPYLEEFPG